MSWKEENTSKVPEKTEEEKKLTEEEYNELYPITETEKTETKNEKKDDEILAEQYKKETGKRITIVKGKKTKEFEKWINSKQKTKQSEEKEEDEKIICPICGSIGTEIAPGCYGDGTHEFDKTTTKEELEKIYTTSDEPKQTDETKQNTTRSETKKESEEKKSPESKKPIWKDEIENPIDENINAFVKDLRTDLKDYIIKLKSEKIELENKLIKSEEKGYIVILYGIPGIGKSTFCASGVLDGFDIVFLDITNQGRRLEQYKEILESPLFLYEPINEIDNEGNSDLSKNFEKLSHYVVHSTKNRDPKKTIIIIDGWSKAIVQLNSYLRKDILKIGDPKHGLQSDVAAGDWYWRTLRYTQLLFNLESAANRGFKIFLTAEVHDVVKFSTDEKGKLKVYKTGIRAPNVRDDDLYTGDVEAFFRNSYDPIKDIVGPREIEIVTSKVPGFVSGTIFTMPKMKTFIESQGKHKTLDFK